MHCRVSFQAVRSLMVPFSTAVLRCTCAERVDGLALQLRSLQAHFWRVSTSCRRFPIVMVAILPVLVKKIVAKHTIRQSLL